MNMNSEVMFDETYNEPEKKHRGVYGEAMQRLMRNKTAMSGLIVMVVITLMCVFADVIAPYGYNDQNIMEKFQPPSWKYLLGTDNLGRDIFSRILFGGRESLKIGFLATAISALFGTFLGSIAGFYGGRTDNIIMRVLDVFMAIPHLVLAIALAAILGSGMTSATLAVGIASIPAFARTIRAPILTVKEMEFVEAARAIDASDMRIIFKHVFANVLSPVIVQATLSVATAITTGAMLSFLGLGVQPPHAEWGTMLAGGRSYIVDQPLLVAFPGLAIAVVVLAMNLFGDGLRDALDPRLRD